MPDHPAILRQQHMHELHRPGVQHDIVKMRSNAMHGPVIPILQHNNWQMPIMSKQHSLRRKEQKMRAHRLRHQYQRYLLLYWGGQRHQVKLGGSVLRSWSRSCCHHMWSQSTLLQWDGLYWLCHHQKCWRCGNTQTLLQSTHLAVSSLW